MAIALLDKDQFFDIALVFDYYATRCVQSAVKVGKNYIHYLFSRLVLTNKVLEEIGE